MTDDKEDVKQAGIEAANNARVKTLEAMEKRDLTLDKVMLRLKQALSAKKTQSVKLKGAINEAQLPKGFRVIAKTGVIMNRGDMDDDPFGDGESLIQFDEVAHGPRLTAINLSLQLFDSMPSQKHEHTGRDGGPINHSHSIKELMNLKVLKNAIDSDSGKTK